MLPSFRCSRRENKSSEHLYLGLFEMLLFRKRVPVSSRISASSSSARALPNICYLFVKVVFACLFVAESIPALRKSETAYTMVNRKILNKRGTVTACCLEWLIVDVVGTTPRVEVFEERRRSETKRPTRR